MFKYVLPAVAALGLIAAAAQTRATADPALESGLGWHLSQEEGMAKLAYGVANSDQLALMLTCEPGQGSAVVYGDMRPAGARYTRAVFTPAPIDPLSGDLSEETRLSLRDPALRDLARSGRMAVNGEDGPHRLTADRAERRAVGAFLDYCGAGRA